MMHTNVDASSFARRLRRPICLLGLTLLWVAGAADARTARDMPLAALVDKAGTVFRGRCLEREIGEMAIAGGRFPVTRYSFEVEEYVKGNGPVILRFKQIGTPDGGAADLGRTAGLPVYEVDGEYVVLLLPEGPAGLTSPAGAADGVFAVDGDRMHALGRSDPAHGLTSYRLLRAMVDELGTR